MLRRSPSLTEQARSLIKARIINDDFDGGRIPSETELAGELGVSRTTIRDALSRLELEGVIYRKQGAGTFVNQASLQIQTRLEEIWAYGPMLEAHGYSPTTRIVSVETEPAEAKRAAELKLDAEATVLVVQKLFLADDQPVIFTTNTIPSRSIKGPYTEEIFHQPIYHFLNEVCHQHLAYYLSELVPLISPAWLCDMFELPSSEPTALICFDEVGYDHEHQPILKARSYFQDDLLRLRLMRRET